ncbi:MAG: DUF4058 family protein [Gemmataceae bacterium]
MPSPFLGMDPYLEAPRHNADFQLQFLLCLEEALLDLLPDGYDSRLDFRARPFDTVDCPPDITVVPRHNVTPLPWLPHGWHTVTVSAPTNDEERVRFLQVHRGTEQQVVTHIEILSRSSKSGYGLCEYERTRAALLRRNVHVVEFNLLVGGTRPEIQSPWPAGDYYGLVIRGGRRPQAGVKCWSVRAPLPAIPIPLRAPDPDISVDLAPVFATAYERGRYARRLDYAAPVPAPLADADRGWAEGVARSALGSPSAS